MISLRKTRCRDYEAGFRLKKPVVIWGGGARGKSLYRILGSENVVSFVDQNKDLQKEGFCDCPILSFDEFLKSDYYSYPVVVSAFNFEKEIEKQLKKHNHNCYFLLSGEISELQGQGVHGFYKRIPLPDDKNEKYVIIGSTLFACICYEWFVFNGYKNIAIYTDDNDKRKGIISCLEYEMTSSLDGISKNNCFVASREPFIGQLNRDNMVDLFDLSKVIRIHNNGLLKYKNMHHGQKCLVVGNGPSLRLEDILRVRDVYTFGVNRIYLLSEKWQPDYYVCMDQKVLEDENIYSCRAKTKFFPASVKERLKEGDEYVFLSNRYSYESVFEVPFSDDITHTVYSGGNVIYAVLQIAVYMGFVEIYLVGVDCSYPKDKPSHFYGNDFDVGGDPQWGISINSFQSAKKYADAHGIKIYNATRGGELEVFERVDFDTLDFLKSKTETEE